MKPDLLPVRESWAGRGLWAPARPGASVCIARSQDHVTTVGQWWLGRGLCSPELGFPGVQWPVVLIRAPVPPGGASLRVECCLSVVLRGGWPGGRLQWALKAVRSWLARVRALGGVGPWGTRWGWAQQGTWPMGTWRF